MTISEFISRYLNENKLSQRQFAKNCGLSNGYISMLINNENPKTKKPLVPSLSALISLSKGMGITVDELIEQTDDIDVDISFAKNIAFNGRPIARKRLPMLGNVACGEPIFAEEEHNAYVDADANMDADFCLTAQGDSMINARIFDGDILFVKKQNAVQDGEIAVVLIEDSATVKRVYYDKENNVLTLMPENPTHKPMRFTGSQLEQIRILGKVIAGQYLI